MMALGLSMKEVLTRWISASIEAISGMALGLVIQISDHCVTSHYDVKHHDELRLQVASVWSLDRFKFCHIVSHISGTMPNIMDMLILRKQAINLNESPVAN